MEAFLLLAKLHYFCANFPAVLHDIEKSRLDGAKTQFTTLRSLKLAAEGYAVKGMLGLMSSKYRVFPNSI